MSWRERGRFLAINLSVTLALGSASAATPAPAASATDDPDLALIGVQSFVLVDPKERHLEVEQLFRFVNLGDLTWNAGSMPVALPSDATAVELVPSTAPIRGRIVTGQGVIFTGVVPPGSVDVAFHYQLPYQGDGTERFTLTLPPRVAQLRVMTPVSTKTSLDVQGFPPPVQMRDSEAGPMMVVDRAVAPFGDQVELVAIRMRGVPTPGKGRWIAVLLCSLAMTGGLALALSRKLTTARKPGPDFETTRDTLLEKVRELDVDHEAGRINYDHYLIEKEDLITRLGRVLMEINDSATKTRPR